MVVDGATKDPTRELLLSMRAVCHLHIHQRSNGQFYSMWEIELYSGNDPKWLARHKKALVKHVQDNFGCYWLLGDGHQEYRCEVSPLKALKRNGRQTGDKK